MDETISTSTQDSAVESAARIRAEVIARVFAELSEDGQLRAIRQARALLCLENREREKERRKVIQEAKDRERRERNSEREMSFLE